MEIGGAAHRVSCRLVVVSDSARQVALDALVRVDDGAYAHILVPEMLRKVPLEQRDRAFVTELVYGTVRMQRTLDHLLTGVASRPLDSLDPPVRAALRLGAYQLVIGLPAHAAVGETVAVVPERARGFANGVLRALTRAGPPWRLPAGDSVAALGVRTSHPDWIVDTFRTQFGVKDAVAILTMDDAAAPVTLRVNTARASVDDVEAELRDGGVKVERGALVRDALVLYEPGDVGALAVVRDGRATPQDQASQAIVAALDPQPDDHVLDIASAPGGKATAAAETMGNEGVVVAADLHPGRVRTVKRAAQRLELVHTIVPVVADGRALPFRDASFDRVLLDAPCSGLGVLRRRPDARWRVQPSDVDDLFALQRVLLATAAKLVRPGGRLVYSVCTLTREETIAVDEWAAEHLTDFLPLDRPPSPWRPHGRGALVLPSDAGTDGMFMLAFERT
jgi:16S rRNA (cytosine967-C5)-methyltransferase